MAPGRPDPYLVWLSETLLQQTTVATVIPYFERFQARFPSLEAVASSEEEEVLTLWSGLGYYARARRFRYAAQILWEKQMAGQDARVSTPWPMSVEAWQALPGVGPYTAAAVCAMAFGLPVVPVDGNIRRILTRLWGEREAKAQQVANWAALWPERCRLPWGDFAQALMDLGALVCRPRQPACEHCPWRGECRSASTEMVQKPVKRSAGVKPRRVSFALCILNEHGEIYLEKGQNNLFKGLLTVPFVDVAQDGPVPLPTFRHVLSHFDWWVTVLSLPARVGQASLLMQDLPIEVGSLLKPYAVDVFPYELRKGSWFSAAQLKQAPISSLLRRILKATDLRIEWGCSQTF